MFLKFIKDNYLILLIFLLGLALRIYDLATESIWFDEAFSAAISNNDPFKIMEIVFNRGVEGNPPLYYITLHFWMQAFGDSEFALRLLSALFGTASIIATYALGKLMFNTRAGIMAALILSVSLFHIQFSQEARAYTMMAFFSIMSFYFFIRLTERRHISYGVLYLLSSVLMVYAHYYGIFVLAAQNFFCLTLFVIKRRAGAISITKWIILQLALLASFIPGLMHMMKIRATVQKSFWIEEPTIDILGQYLVRYSGSIYLLIIFTVFLLIALIGIRRISSIPGLKTLFEAPQDENAGPGISTGYRVYLLLLWFLFPIVIPYVISVVSNPMYVARYAISATIAFYLLATYGISGLKSRWVVTAIGIFILALSMAVLPHYYKYPYKHQWREVLEEIEAGAGSGDVVVILPAHEEISAKYYSSRDDIEILPMHERFPSFKNLGDRSVWVVMHAHPENRRQIRQGLSPKYNFELAKGFVRLDLFRLRQK